MPRFETEEEQQYFDFLIQTGVLIPTDQQDEDGDPVYRLDIEAAETFAPDFYKDRMKDLDDDLMHLFQEELIDFELSDDLATITWKIAPKGEELVKQLFQALTDD